MENEKYVTRNSIISYVYKVKNNIEKIDYFNDKKYKNFMKECIKDINSICESLDINIKLYKVKDNEYKIPYILGELIKVYLLQDSKKGSIISKLKQKKYSEITYEEKIQLNNSIIEKLKENNLDDESEKIIKNLNKYCIVKEKLNEDLKQIAERTKLVTNNFIDEIINSISGYNKNDGFIKVNPSIRIDLGNIDDDLYSSDELIEKIRCKLRCDRNFYDKKTLTYDDMAVLSNYLRFWIIDSMTNFLDIVNDFSELREEDVSEHEANQYKDSKVLLKEAINEYKDNLILNSIPKKLPPENMDEIMKEIMNEMLEKQE